MRAMGVFFVIGALITPICLICLILTPLSTLHSQLF